jgi:hypothetical protein
MFSRQVLRSVRAAAPQRALALRAAPVRSFAAAASDESARPPVAVFGLDGTYATALVRAEFLPCDVCGRFNWLCRWCNFYAARMELRE